MLFVLALPQCFASYVFSCLKAVIGVFLKVHIYPFFNSVFVSESDERLESATSWGCVGAENKLNKCPVAGYPANIIIIPNVPEK